MALRVSAGGEGCTHVILLRALFSSAERTAYGKTQLCVGLDYFCLPACRAGATRVNPGMRVSWRYALSSSGRHMRLVSRSPPRYLSSEPVGPEAAESEELFGRLLRSHKPHSSSTPQLPIPMNRRRVPHLAAEATAAPTWNNRDHVCFPELALFVFHSQFVSPYPCGSAK